MLLIRNAFRRYRGIASVNDKRGERPVSDDLAFFERQVIFISGIVNRVIIRVDLCSVVVG